jgi:sec-independent protein translocase protein TatB
MFGIDSSELFVVGLVALLVIGPSRLPMAMRSVGQWVAKGRAITRHVRTGFDAMVREAELEEMQKSWAKHNEAIMKATALNPAAMLEADPMPTPPEAPAPPARDAAGALPETDSATVMAEAQPPAAPDVAVKRPRAPRKRSAKSINHNG